MTYSVKENVFEVDNPIEFYCSILRYGLTHRGMFIKAMSLTTKEADFFLIFTSVLYFEGPTRWYGAKFDYAAPEECLETIHQVASLEIWPTSDLRWPSDNLLLRTYRLFKVETELFVVRFLANKYVEKLDKNPLQRSDY